MEAAGSSFIMKKRIVAQRACAKKRKGNIDTHHATLPIEKINTQIALGRPRTFDGWLLKRREL